MRIAIFTPFLYPFHVDMAKALHDKVEVKIFTCGIYGNYPFEELLRYRYVETLKCTNIVGSKSLEPISLTKFVRFRPHVIIIFGIESIAGIVLYFLSRFVKAKTIVIVEENNITFHNNFFLDFLQKLKMLIVRYIYKKAPILIAESDASKRYILETLHVKRDNPIIVRVHGIDTSKYIKFMSMPEIQAKKMILRFWGLSDNLLTKKWCAFVGDPSYSKGVDVLIDAIEILKADQRIIAKTIFFIPKMKLLRDKEDLEEIYKQKLMKLTKYGLVFLYPPVKPEDIPIFYRAVDLIMLPSRLLPNASSDRSPNIALEAIASGKILIASYAGGIPTIVGSVAILVKPNDPHALANALLKVLASYEEYKYLEGKARERAQLVLDIRYYLYDLVKAIVESEGLRKSEIYAKKD
jgi:glycosyltransferase involved in cell wall biosynthesis